MGQFLCTALFPTPPPRSGTIYTSPDGSIWSLKNSTTMSALTSVTYGNSQFVAVGFNDTIFTSPDATTWTGKASGAPNRINSVTFGNNQFVAGEDYGTILTSSDGSTWTKTSSGISASINFVYFVNNRYIAVCQDGTILISQEYANGGVSQKGFFKNLINTVTANVHSNRISIKPPSEHFTSRLNVEFVNFAGKAIHSVSAMPNNGSLNFQAADITTGIYLLKITDGKNITVVNILYSVVYENMYTIF